MKWEKVASLPVCHTVHSAVLLGGSVYVGSGHERRNLKEKEDCYRLDIFNLFTNHWPLLLHTVILL